MVTQTVCSVFRHALERLAKAPFVSHRSLLHGRTKTPPQLVMRAHRRGISERDNLGRIYAVVGQCVSVIAVENQTKSIQMSGGLKLGPASFHLFVP
jgi:hypothetical protein